jgi:hypothetical protein
MAKRHKAMTWAITKPSGVPAAVKDMLSARAHKLVDSELKPKHVQPPPRNPRFNYIIDLSTRWHGRFFYFVSKYASPGPNALSPFFEADFARLEYQRDGRFSLAYMRHTGQWWQVYTDLTLTQALNIIREEPLFQP